MNNGTNPIKADAEGELSWVAFLLDELVHDLMDTSMSKDERAKYLSNDDIIISTSKVKISG